jgi:hypothetical protein
MRRAAIRHVIGRDRNVVRVDFRRRPDPPAPRFPGAAALRRVAPEFVDACATVGPEKEVA